MNTNNTNYQALGEYTAYKAQAKDAAGRRFACLSNLAGLLSGAAKKPDQRLSEETVQAALKEIFNVERELQAALTRANEAAALARMEAVNLYGMFD